MNLDKATAKKLYASAPDWFKAELENEFGADYFRPKDFKSIKTFANACTEVGTTEEEFNERIKPLGLANDTLAYEKLKIVAKAINNGWQPDWTNTNQRKWWPWFNLSSGFGFSGSGYVYGHSGTNVGSRLCYESEAKSDYAAKQFIDLYEELITIKN